MGMFLESCGRELLAYCQTYNIEPTEAINDVLERLDQRVVAGGLTSTQLSILHSVRLYYVIVKDHLPGLEDAVHSARLQFQNELRTIDLVGN
jgi:hypothetical protein